MRTSIGTLLLILLPSISHAKEISTLDAIIEEVMISYPGPKDKTGSHETFVEAIEIAKVKPIALDNDPDEAVATVIRSAYQILASGISIQPISSLSEAKKIDIKLSDLLAGTSVAKKAACFTFQFAGTKDGMVIPTDAKELSDALKDDHIYTVMPLVSGYVCEMLSVKYNGSEWTMSSSRGEQKNSFHCIQRIIDKDSIPVSVQVNDGTGLKPLSTKAKAKINKLVLNLRLTSIRPDFGPHDVSHAPYLHHKKTRAWALYRITVRMHTPPSSAP